MDPSRSARDCDLGRGISRRRFIAGVAGVIACACADLSAPPAEASAPAAARAAGDESDMDLASWLTLGPLADVAVGYPVGFPFARPAAPGLRRSVETGVAYVVTYDGRTATAFANLCTHHGCRVSWDAGRKVFLCPCHNGAFDIDGINIEGCPQRPLERFETRVVDGLIQIRTAKPSA